MTVFEREASRLFVPEPKRGRRGRAVQIRRSTTPTRVPDARGRLRRMVTRVPEVVVKVTGAGKDIRGVRGSARYISRRGTLPLEDARGNTYLGPDAVEDALATWEKGGAGSAIPKTGGVRRESLNIVLSMPADVDRPSVARAARAFAAATFEGHEYLIADHDDTDHPHAHLVVRMTGHNGRRLNPRKADFARWREGFAEALREQGLEANATQRTVRGAVRRAVSRSMFHMEREGRHPEVRALQINDAFDEVKTGIAHTNPAAKAIAATRRKVLMSYGRISNELLAGTESDRTLALAVTRFAQSMTPVGQTRHRELVDELCSAPSSARAPERDRGPER